ncbi:MAG: hypothetical protein ABSH29_07925 [Acidimicrobiales bacterium]|jgi:hypothetical protein
MSALPAETTELSPRPHAVRPSAGLQLRAERRAEQARARRERIRWSVVGVAILGCSFALTVGVLDVLH